MKIYTKTGDQGDTSLYGGHRVPKDALRIEAYGTIDELNSFLGIVIAGCADAGISRTLAELQHRLFDLGADLATPRSLVKPGIKRFEPKDARPIERTIDKVQAELPPLKNFILPGGTPLSARLHFARTICRRAERAVVRLSRNEDIGQGITVYLNRLSDLLFVLARLANHRESMNDIKWQP